MALMILIHIYLFDFFRFGQPGQGPPPDQLDGPHEAPNAAGWGLWPEPNHQQQQLGPNQQQVGHGEAFVEQVDLEQGEPHPVDNEIPNLNMAPVEDLGKVDDLIPEQGIMNDGEDTEEQPEDILAMSSSSDDEAPNNLVLDLNIPMEVEVFIPMENGV